MCTCGRAVGLFLACWASKMLGRRGGGGPCDGLGTHPGGSSDTPSHFMLRTL